MKSRLAETFPKDLGSSVVVFLVALPLCMGIAIASGVPPAAGLITGMVGGLIAGALSGCPLQVSGPAAGLSVFVYQLVQEHGIGMLGPIVLGAGLLQLIAGTARLGQVFRSIAPSVIYGMLAGIGVLIFAAQFHVMVDDQPRGSGLENLLAIPQSILKGMNPADGTSSHLAALIAVLTLAVLIGWSKLVPSRFRIVPAALVAVALGTLVAALLKLPIHYVDVPNDLLGTIRLPEMSKLTAVLQPKFLIDIFAMAFVASAESLLSAAAVDQMHSGPRTNYNKELRSQGIGNMICGFVGSLPMTGVIVRSSTNVQAGAATRMSAMMHGVWLTALVVAFPSLLRMVPTASLAAVLVFTGYKLVSPANIKKLWGYGPQPVAVYAATLVMIVATDLLTGILVGLGLSMVKLVYALTHMGVRIVRNDGRVDVYLSGAATFLRLPKLADTLDSIQPDVKAHIHFKGLDYIDHACVDLLQNWAKKRGEQSQSVTLEWSELMEMYRDRNALRPPAKTSNTGEPVAA
jgi:MFS superfamily sulfate permease-like transporter